jgi:DNA-binding transcriptional MerR regulator
VLINEAARRAGVTRDTVRLYTRLGLVRCRTRDAGSRQYADYDDDAVELVRNIRIARSIGFTLAELRPIAEEYLAGTLDPDKQRACWRPSSSRSPRSGAGSTRRPTSCAARSLSWPERYRAP